MQAGLKGILVTGASILALAMPEIVQAAETAPDRLQDIVVTAEKRSESLQTTPLAISALDAKALEVQVINNLADVSRSVPSLQFGVNAVDSYGTEISIRGIGSNSQSGNTDPGVALSVNGVYMARSSAAVTSLFDVERIEVLRGPQGTLYGRNSTGGAINIIPTRPKQGVTEAMIEGTYGNYNLVRLRGIVNAPLADNVAFRMSSQYEKRDGYVKNLVSGKPDQDNADNFAIRPSLSIDAGGALKVLVSSYYSRMKQDGSGVRYLGVDGGPNGYPAGPVAVAFPQGGPPFSVDAFPYQTLSAAWTLQPLPTDLHQVRKNTPEQTNVKQYGADLTLDYAMSDAVTLRSITSYQHTAYDLLVDADSSELNLATNQMVSSAHQFSTELNLIGETDRLKWVLGAFYLDEASDETFTVATCPKGCLTSNGYKGPFIYPPFITAGSPPDQGWIHHTVQQFGAKAYAGFGQFTWSMTDKLSLTTGARWSRDEKSILHTGIGPGYLDFVPNVPNAQVNNVPDKASSHSWSKITGRATLDYKITDKTMIYASFARGYKSGGEQLTSDGSSDVTGIFNPEVVDTYEAGLRTRFLDNRVQLNLTGFTSDYKNFQTFELTLNGPLVINAGAARIKGAEFEIRVLPVQRLHINASGAFLDAKYTSFKVTSPSPTGPVTEDFTGNRLNRAPKFSGDISADYTVPTSWGSVTGNLGYSYVGAQYYDRGNLAVDRQASRGLVRASLNFDMGSYAITFWGNNITNEKYVSSQRINPAFSGGTRLVNIGAPATYGVTLRAKF
jgi:iron complex outermembrane receptor protein